MVAHALVFLLGGADTIITPISGCLYHLLKNPDKLHKLQREIRSKFRSDSEINIQAVHNSPYLVACIKEALRMCPPLPAGLVRVVPRGGGDIAGSWIPSGVSLPTRYARPLASHSCQHFLTNIKTMVECQQWAMGYSKENWQDAGTFRPERFLEHNGFDNMEAFEPFSVGPRGCLGRK
jgi:cytochrome P450